MGCLFQSKLEILQDECRVDSPSPSPDRRRHYPRAAPAGSHATYAATHAELAHRAYEEQHHQFMQALSRWDLEELMNAADSTYHGVCEGATTYGLDVAANRFMW